jgi:hypothetical protein
MAKMVIQVGKDGSGKHFASRSFEGLGSNIVFSGNVFTLKQNEDESIQGFEERVRQEARRHKIKYVERLD